MEPWADAGPTLANGMQSSVSPKTKLHVKMPTAPTEFVYGRRNPPKTTAPRTSFIAGHRKEKAEAAKKLAPKPKTEDMVRDEKEVLLVGGLIKQMRDKRTKLKDAAADESPVDWEQEAWLYRVRMAEERRRREHPNAAKPVPPPSTDDAYWMDGTLPAIVLTKKVEEAPAPSTSDEPPPTKADVEPPPATEAPAAAASKPTDVTDPPLPPRAAIVTEAATTTTEFAPAPSPKRVSFGTEAAAEGAPAAPSTAAMAPAASTTYASSPAPSASSNDELKAQLKEIEQSTQALEASAARLAVSEARVEALLVEVERLKAGERMAMARAEAAEAREAYLLSTSTKAKEYKEKGLTLTSEEARSEVLASEVQRLRAELAKSAADADAAIAGEVAKNAIEGALGELLYDVGGDASDAESDASVHGKTAVVQVM